MKTPYGLSNFATIIREQYNYVDKTAFIRTLEDENRLNVLLRPRRFGKSLFLSMLSYYYDINHKNDFKKLFDQLTIGKKPTPNRNSYQILFFDFSGIDTTDQNNVYAGFTKNIEVWCKQFLVSYDYPENTITELKQLESPVDKIRHTLSVAKPNKVYLLIDEYDHFANALLADDLKHFRNIMGKGGFVRAFYEVIKTGTQQGVIDRLFITGVTPIMLDSLTSGFNVAQNLTLHPKFNDAIGFNKNEVRVLIQPLVATCSLNENELLENLARWYNGYLFTDHFKHNPHTMFNADMVLYFINNFDVTTCEYPRNMLDENIASDYGKILAMFSIGNRDDNYQILEQLIEHNEVHAKQRRKIDFDKGFDQDDFVSLLYYMGFITYKAITLAQESFKIPNYVIKTILNHCVMLLNKS